SELAWHIVAAENMFYEAVLAGTFNYNHSRPEAVKTPADIVKWYRETAAANLQKIAELSGEQLSKVLDFRGIFQAPAVTFLQVGLNHSIHHRGQVSVYLRPMGAKVPVIYGESYDSKQAAQAANS